MSELEDRLRAGLRDSAHAVEVVPPAPGPMLAEAAARRERRITGAVSAVALLLLFGVTSTFAAQELGDEDVVAGPPRSAELATDYSTTTTSAPTPAPGSRKPAPAVAPTTTATRRAPVVTAPTTTTSPTTAVPATDARPLAQRVPQGLWVVGVDGTNLRRLGDVGRHAWSPDGTKVAIATDRIWILSAADGRAVSTIELGAATTGVACLDWSATGTLGWVTSEGAVHYARSTDRVGKVVATVAPQELSAYDDGCLWSPDGARFATGGDGFVVLDEAGTRVEVAKAPAAATTSGAKWSPDGRSLAALARNAEGRRTVAVLGGEGWSTIAEVSGSSDAVRLVWSADGEKLLIRESLKTTSYDPVAKLTTVETTQVFPGLTPLPGGDFLTVGSGAALQFVSAGWEPRGTLLTAEAHPDECRGAFFASIRMSPDGRQLAVEAQAQGGGWRCDKVRAS